MVPQPPQFVESDCASVQIPSHTTSPFLHSHAPWTHCCPTAHAAPHAPQLAGSLDRSMHEPLHVVRPVGHTPRQVPAAHTGASIGQVSPHTPQSEGLCVRSAQRPPQLVVPAGHWQLLAAHTVPPTHAIVQPPQAAELVRVSTHDPLQATRPPGHDAAHDPELHTSPAAQRLVHDPQ